MVPKKQRSTPNVSIDVSTYGRMLSTVQSLSPMPRPEIFQRTLSQLAAVATPRFQFAKYSSVRSAGHPV